MASPRSPFWGVRSRPYHTATLALGEGSVHFLAIQFMTKRSPSPLAFPFRSVERLVGASNQGVIVVRWASET